MAENSGRRAIPVRIARGVGGLLAIAAILGGAVAAGTAIFPRLRGEPEPSLDPDLVVVAALENRTGNASLDPLGRQAAARITEAVHRRGVAEVVSAGAAMAEADAPEGDQTHEATATLARASRAGIVVHGSYYLLGDSLQFQIQITDVAEGKLLSSSRPLMAHRQSPTDALRLVQERTLGSLVAALDYRSGDLNFPTQPPSLEAYRLYRQGQETWDRIELEEALGFFEQARATDSTWMSPLFYVSLTLGGLNRYAEMDSALRVAAGHREHMSEPEDILFTTLRSHVDDEDPTVKLRNIRRLVEIAPAIGLRWGYWVAFQAHRPREALGFFARVDTASSRFEQYEHEYWRLMAEQHHLLGQHEEELEVAQEARLRFPDNMLMLEAHLAALAALGRTAEIQALLDTVFALPETQVGDVPIVPPLRALTTAYELRAHGHSDAARKAVLESGLAWLEDRQNVLGYKGMKANFLYELGRWEEARRLYELLLEQEDPEPEITPSLRALMMARLAGTAARLGEPERARAISAELADSIQARLDRAPANVLVAGMIRERARIAAALGERDEAVQLLQEGFRLSRHKGNDVFLAHRIGDFETLHDYPPYQQFLKPRG